MNALESLDEDLLALQNSMNNLKKLVNEPYDQLEKQIETSERALKALHLVRKISNFLQLHRKLKETKEYSMQATLIYELDAFVSDKDLMKIEIIVDERAAIVNSKQRLLHIANRDLMNGIQEGNEDTIMNSLVIYRNMAMLGTFLDNQIQSYVNDIKNSLKLCFEGSDVATLQKTSIKSSPSNVKVSGQKMPGKQLQLTTSMNFKNKLLAGLEWLFTDELQTYCEQAIIINQCLKKVTRGFITEDPSKNFLLNFSKAICELLRNSFEESPVHVLQNLQQCLPKLLSFFNGLQEKIGKDIELNKNIFSNLNNGYIEKCAQNLKMPINEGVTEDLIDNILKNATNELTVSLIDEDLLNSVINIVCACNIDFFNKIKATIKFGGDAEQVLSIPNASQLININSANLVFYHHQKTMQMLIALDLQKSNKIAYNKIKRSIDDGKNSVIMPILRQLNKQLITTINTILLSMHREPSISTDNLKVSAPSEYMRELQEFIKRSWTSHMSPFADKNSVAVCAKDLCTKTIELFVQNLSILRPISIKGRERMKSDCGHLENLLQTIVHDLSILGNSYRTLRAIASLIVEKPGKLVEVESNLIPSYIILFMLFGHADENLKSPHKTANWSDEALIKWLEQHKERECLELIGGALQKYRNIVRKQELQQYDPIYPLISTMLEKCLATCAPNPPPARGLL